MAKWTFSNEAAFDLMSCRVEKEWSITIIDILKAMSLCDMFAIRKTDCNLLEYALRCNYVSVFVFLMRRFYEYIMETQFVSFAMPCNMQGDTLLHLLIRYNCYELIQRTPDLLQFIDSFMDVSNVDNETPISLACEMKNKIVIETFIDYRPFLLEKITSYYEFRNCEEMLLFICNRFCYVLPKRFYI